MRKSGGTPKKNMGIWIDHREAVLVQMEGGEVTVDHIASNAESHFRPTGGWKASGTAVAQSVTKERKADERRKHQLHDFYQAVIKKAEGADHIFIFGPGEAKLELAKWVKARKDLTDRISAVEPCDKLSENQLVAKVKAFFASP